MKIRVEVAEKGDKTVVLGCLEMLRKFSNESPIGAKHFYAPSVSNMIAYAIQNGVCLVAYEGPKMIGTCLGSISVNPWTRFSKELREIAWYVLKEHRGTSAGIQLYNRYVEISKEMIEEKVISASFMTTQPASGDAIERIIEQDFEKSETHFIMGG